MIQFNQNITRKGCHISPMLWNEIFKITENLSLVVAFPFMKSLCLLILDRHKKHGVNDITHIQENVSKKIAAQSERIYELLNQE